MSLQTDNDIIQEANDPQKLASLNPTPILFVPTSKFQRNCATPLGVFSALVVEMSADGKWKCNKSEFCFKNRIQFDVVDRTSSRTYTIELRLYATYIELRHIHGPIDTKVLVAFHHELCDALDRISQQFIVTQKALSGAVDSTVPVVCLKVVALILPWWKGISQQ